MPGLTVYLALCIFLIETSHSSLTKVVSSITTMKNLSLEIYKSEFCSRLLAMKENLYQADVYLKADKKEKELFLEQ